MTDQPWLSWTFARLRCRLRALRLAWRSAWRPSLGAHVRYKGRTWFISNGVSSGSWALVSVDRSSRISHAPRAECRWLWTPSESWQMATRAWSWYMTSWYHIDVGRLCGMPGAYYGRRSAKQT